MMLSLVILFAIEDDANPMTAIMLKDGRAAVCTMWDGGEESRSVRDALSGSFHHRNRGVNCGRQERQTDLRCFEEASVRIELVNMHMVFLHENV